MAQLKILLCAVNAKYIHSNPAVHLLKAYALKRMSSLCAPSDLPLIETAEYTINNRCSDVLADIYEKKPDAVFFSCYIWNIGFIKNLLADIHSVLPETAVWLGGPEVSFDPQEQLKSEKTVAGIILGEGEETFFRLVAEYYVLHRKELPQIEGICFRDDADPENPVTTAPRALISMDEVPFIYEDAPESLFRNRILYYESSRGCPFGCSYCLSSVDRTVRLRSMEKVKKELKYFLDKKVPQVKFVDRTFNIDHMRSAQILEFIRENDNGITNFHFEIAGDLLSETELDIMERMRPGLIQLEIGVQSVNEKTLEAINRKTGMERLRQVVARIKNMGNIHIHLDLIAGLPYEDYESFQHSFNEVFAMKPEQLQLGFLKVLKGSPMFFQTGKFRIRYGKNAPYEVLSTGWIPYDRILLLKRIEEMTELYYNSAQFTKTIAFLETVFETPFDLFEKLAGFYREKDLFTNSPSRIHKYKVLLDFITEYYPQYADIVRELLTFDLYLRENMKSRPDFAPDPDQDRELLRKALLNYQESAGKQSRSSIHADCFHYPVYADNIRDMASSVSGRKYIAIFDYRFTDPLSHNALVQFYDESLIAVSEKV